MKWEEIVNFCPGFVSPTTVRARELRHHIAFEVPDGMRLYPQQRQVK